MVGHLQVFALSDSLSLTLPVEYSATTKGLLWLIPRNKLPWTKENLQIRYNHSNQAVATHTRKFNDSTIKFHAGEAMDHSIELKITNFSNSLHKGLPLPVNIYPRSSWPVAQQNVTIKNTPYGLPLSSDEYYTYFLVSAIYLLVKFLSKKPRFDILSCLQRGEPMSANAVLKRFESYTGCVYFINDHFIALESGLKKKNSTKAKG